MLKSPVLVLTIALLTSTPLSAQILYQSPVVRGVSLERPPADSTLPDDEDEMAEIENVESVDEPKMQAQNTHDLDQRIADLDRQARSSRTNISNINRDVAAVGGSTESANMEVRLSQIEERLRGITGRLEELEFGLNSVKSDVEKLSKDVDFRLREIEQKGAGTTASTETPATNAPKSQSNGDGSKNLGEVPATADNANKSVQEQYDDAFGLVRQNKYDEGITALNQFIEHHPKDPLTGNAYYWLGETYFTKEQYDKASVQFAKGYQAFPKGTKAPDNLLKLGSSLGKLGKKKEACTTFSTLAKEFPKMPAAIKTRMDQEKKTYKC